MKDYKVNLAIIFTIIAMTGCGGSGGGSTNNVSAPSNQATSSISANPTKVFLGDSMVISWSSANASSCTALGNWSGDKSISGSETVAMTNEGDKFFTIICGDASSSVTVVVNTEDSEGSCVNPHNAGIPQSYIGEYEVPMAQNSFGDDHFKGIGFKDYSARQTYTAHQRAGSSWIDDCTITQYKKLMYRMTLRRLKDHGVNTVSIYNYGYWDVSSDGSWEINHDTKDLSDADMDMISVIAHDLGLDVHYAWQFNMRIANTDQLLFPFDGNVRLDLPLLKNIMDAHEKHMIWEADRAEWLKLKAISADWSAMWLCFSCALDGQGHTQAETDALKDYYMERMSILIDKIRDRFSGQVYIGEGVVWNDKRVFDKVDGVGLSVNMRLTAEEVAYATVDLLQEKAAESIQHTFEEWNCLDGPCWHNSSTTIPKIIFNFFSQSNTRYLSKGWWEDGFCTAGNLDGVYYECTQYEIQTDFSAQAILTEALLRAVDNQVVFEVLGTTTTTGYWLSDTLYAEPNQHRNKTPLEGFPNISQSVRGKPAEKIIKYWYTGEYEIYEPIFTD